MLQLPPVLSKGVMLKRYLSSQRVGIFALLIPVLLLPMLHLHPAYDHGHGVTEGHEHHSTVHADFFPDATHGHENQSDPGQHGQDLEATTVSLDASSHTLSQVNLLSLHMGQSFQFSSVFKKNPPVLDQDSLDLSNASHLQNGVLIRRQTLLFQTPHFSTPSLRAPPYFA
jgi:hypothetical protein